MTRSISTSMAGVLEKLELERPTVITSDTLSKILEEEGIQTPVRIVAARLREKGWLLPTSIRGAWEFVPASSAGAYSSNDPLLSIMTVMSKHKNIQFGATFQTAAWMHGIADRVPTRLEVAIKDAQSSRLLHEELTHSVFAPKLDYRYIRGVPVLSPESIIVHITAKPRALRSWQSVLEWLPDLAASVEPKLTYEELEGRSNAIIARTGYLLQGMRPDISESLYKKYPQRYKTWFGPRRSLLRHDNKWLIADTLLPFDPRKMDAVI